MNESAVPSSATLTTKWMPTLPFSNEPTLTSPNALVNLEIADHHTSHDRREGLCTLQAFDLARSVGYGEVEYLVMPELSSLLALNAGDSYVDFGCGIGCFLLFLAMAHPQCNFAGVEVVASC